MKAAEMRKDSLRRQLPGICIAFILAGCAGKPATPEVQACLALHAVECRTLLEKKGLVGKASNAILREVAGRHVANERVEPAIEYLDLVIENDNDDVAALQLRGDARAINAARKQMSARTIDRLLARADYVMAAADYLIASLHERDNQELYRKAVHASVEAGACDLANSIRKVHAEAFGDTNDHAALVDAITQKCGLEEK